MSLNLGMGLNLNPRSYSRRYKIMLAVVVLVAVALVVDGMLTGFVIRFASSRYVNRAVSPNPVEANNDLTVTLDVGILPGDRFFIIDEVIPGGGWTIIDSGSFFDAGTANASEAGHLKMVVIQGAGDTSYDYTIRAPATPNTYTFVGGTFQVDGMNNTQTIGGEFSVMVSPQIFPETCNGIDDNGDFVIDEGCDDDNDNYCDAGMERETLYLCDNRGDWCCDDGGGDCDDTPATGFYINPGATNPDSTHNDYCDCDIGTGGGVTEGTAEVCGDGIDQDCDGLDTQCCEITGASWNESQVNDGEAVTLSVNGSAVCGDGEVVDLELWETDGVTSDLVVTVNLGTMTMRGDRASTEWHAVWIRDTGDPTSDPEYFFKATLRSNPLSYNVSGHTLTVITDDEDKDGVRDEMDCNDQDTRIGECTGCATCDDPLNATGRCVDGGTCPAIRCEVRCGYGTCGSDEVPSFRSPSEQAVCSISNSQGRCSTNCIDYGCEYNSDCDLDDDNDGVPDLNDRCPNTSVTYVNRVNMYGCPRPYATKFTPEITTDFNDTDLHNITNMTLGIIGLDQILFIGNVSMLEESVVALSSRYNPIDLDSNVFMSIANVTVDSDQLLMLRDNPSIVTNYDIQIRLPIIFRDNVICHSCIILRPRDYTGGPGNPDNLTFRVPGFTSYGTEESVCGDGYCYIGVEDCSTCEADCGECPPQCSDLDLDGFNGTGPDCDPGAADFDCDDFDNETNPGAVEIVYNGKDDDCDPATRDYDLDLDMNNATAYGGTDCNDNDNTIGRCIGCAVCSDPTGISGTCQPDDSQCDIPCPDTTPCDYGTCNESSFATFINPTEPGSCTVAGNDGTCDAGQCQNYLCFEDYFGCLGDDDNDSVVNRNDFCPNTQGSDRNYVNAHGCPLPYSDKFTPDLTTDFADINLSKIINMTLGITSYGQIEFLGNVTMMEWVSADMDSRYTRLDLDSNVDISHATVSVDSSNLAMLNLASRIILFNLTLTRPVILKDGALCGDDCSIIQYIGNTTKNLTFTVPGFTTYSATEHYCGDGSCDSDLGETCSKCAADCGSCPDPGDGDPVTGPGAPPGGPGPSPACGDRPIQPCLTAVWEDYPTCDWDITQCQTATENCTVNDIRCLGDYLQICEERSPPNWYSTELCYFGCNVNTLSCNPAMTICQEEWSCTDWSNCTDGQETRLCFDSNECNTFIEKPLEVKACGQPLPPGPIDVATMINIATVAGVVIVIIVIAILLKRRKKGDKGFREKAMDQTQGGGSQDDKGQGGGAGQGGQGQGGQPGSPGYKQPQYY